jgi:hypothetical protein
MCRGTGQQDNSVLVAASQLFVFDAALFVSVVLLLFVPAGVSTTPYQHSSLVAALPFPFS